MKTTQLMCVAAVVAMLPAACNRADTQDTAQRAQDTARRAASDVKNVAGRAGDKIGDKLGDGWLTTKIQAQYFADDDVKARYIMVSTRDGVVTLKGRVDNPAARDQALQIARNTDGVRQVNDQLAVTSGARNVPVQADTIWPESLGAVATTGAAAPFSVPPALDDAQITSGVQAKFFLDHNVKARRIAVDTRQGVVTLRGEVASDEERAEALLLARTTQGVQRVEDGLTVNVALALPAAEATTDAGTPAVPVAQSQDAALATLITSRIAGEQGTAVTATAKDGVVLIEGTVPTAAARQRVITLVRTTEGVIQVVDRIALQSRR